MSPSFHLKGRRQFDQDLQRKKEHKLELRVVFSREAEMITIVDQHRTSLQLCRPVPQPWPPVATEYLEWGEWKSRCAMKRVHALHQKKCQVSHESSRSGCMLKSYFGYTESTSYKKSFHPFIFTFFNTGTEKNETPDEVHTVFLVDMPTYSNSSTAPEEKFKKRPLHR